MDKYIIVTGGELFNKGAQAMTYIAADQIKKRWPNCKMVLFSSLDYKRPIEERKKYKFEIFSAVSWRYKMLLRIPGGAIICKKINNLNSKLALEYNKIIRNTEALIDISGYALGSNWGPKRAIGYILTRVIETKRFNIPVYIMPQSFGPFDFKGKYSYIANFLIKTYLPYAQVIMAREKEGLHLLESNFHLKNVVNCVDMVLENKEINKKNIFWVLPNNAMPIIDNHNNVAIIPNINNFRYGSKQLVYDIYKRIINLLIDKNITIYLIYHSSEDLNICKKIKNFFLLEQRVIIIEQELNCFDSEEFIKHMNFVVASRYHSIVHAYKQSVPAIVIGWATKYDELLQLLHQERFQYDVRGPINVESITESIEYLVEHYNDESLIISEALKKITEKNAFDYVKLKSDM